MCLPHPFSYRSDSRSVDTVVCLATALPSVFAIISCTEVSTTSFYLSSYPYLSYSRLLRLSRLDYKPSVRHYLAHWDYFVYLARLARFTCPWLTRQGQGHWPPVWRSTTCNMRSAPCVVWEKNVNLDARYMECIRKRGMHFFSRFSRLIEPYSTFFLINMSVYNVVPKPSILSRPNGGEPSKIR